ncbi:MAG: FtsW/RodA/SpoVE family cell cycle protein [Prevotellaceae bacterium]|jgi:cell division protein FtsW|nr:FtsW/RodA/SpoVE family cell cycle protein [Prevotellaceae bacterium]
MKNFEKYLKGDKTIWCFVALLSIFSLLLVYSSTAGISWRSSGAVPFYYLSKQLVFLLAGFGLMYLCSRTPYTLFMNFAPVAYLAALVLMVVMLFIGRSHNQAVRSLGFFQPAELCKLALILYVARLMTLKQDCIKDFRKGFVPIVLPVIAMCFLIFLSNFSTAAILGVTCFTVMFIGRTRVRYLLATVGSLLALTALALCLTKVVTDAVSTKEKSKEKITGVLLVSNKVISMTRLKTMYSRIEDKFDDKRVANAAGSGALEQPDFSHMAIASGGFLGKGPGNSKMRYYLPEAYSDFIFAILIEEYGILGATVLVLIYLILMFRVGVMVHKSMRFFPAILAIGLITQIMLQALVNMCVATGLTPVTGQNLPLISQGGTSILVTCLMFGMLLSVSRSLEKEEEKSLEMMAQRDEEATDSNDALARETIANLNPQPAVS